MFMAEASARRSAAVATVLVLAMETQYEPVTMLCVLHWDSTQISDSMVLEEPWCEDTLTDHIRMGRQAVFNWFRIYLKMR